MVLREDEVKGANVSRPNRLFTGKKEGAERMPRTQLPGKDQRGRDAEVSEHRSRVAVANSNTHHLSASTQVSPFLAI